VEHPDENEVKNMLEALAKKYDCGQVIVTGVHKNGQLGAEGFCAAEGSFTFAGAPQLPHVFYGTGDVFASIITGCAVRGMGLVESVEKASDYITRTIRRTVELDIPTTDGICIEEFLTDLA
jgi:pyridoxine kinase